MTISIVQVSLNSPLLHEVIKLGDKSAATLGFLPHAAFKQYAEKGRMLAAVDDANVLVGYLLYRTPSRTNHATIAHFCIDSDYRGQGISELLFSELCERTRLLHGIDLKCRRDKKYEAANRMWQRLGFRPIGETSGRGKQDTRLTRWWYQHHHASLFDEIPPDQENFKIVIDTNVFVDFCNLNQAPQESQYLLADWLPSQLEYVVTPELVYELNRQERENVRKHHLQKETNFERVTAPVERANKVFDELKAKYPQRTSENDLSDLKHIAWAVATPNVDFFVTRDDRILELRFEVLQQYQLYIFRPTDLILHLDELARVKEYQHMRLAGTNLNIRQIKAQEDANLAQIFQYPDQENKSAFLNELRDYLSNPTQTPCYIVEDEGTPLILFCYQRIDNDLRIPLFRINTAASQKQLVRYLLLKFVKLSAVENRLFTYITEKKTHPIIEESLQEDAFQRTKDGWIKPSFRHLGNASDTAKFFENALNTHQELKTYYKVHLEILRQPENLANSKMMSELERTLYPAKILDADLTSMIIPIDETWISLWFDEALASATLFGADKQRAFNREGVYYSAANRSNLIVPGRVLWYVTKKTDKQGTMCVRACARLDEIITGPAKELFQQFQHLGIVDWKQLMKMGANDPSTIFTVYRFSDPELFSRSVTFNELRNICLEESGKNPPVYSPSRIPVGVFNKVYKLGMEL